MKFRAVSDLQLDPGRDDPPPLLLRHPPLNLPDLPDLLNRIRVEGSVAPLARLPLLPRRTAGTVDLTMSRRSTEDRERDHDV